MIGDIVRHAQGDPFLLAAVQFRVFGTYVPDKQPLPYILVELTGENSTRTSGNSIAKATIKATAFAKTSQDAERLARIVTKRLTESTPRSTEVGVSFLDVKQVSQFLMASSFRTADGALGFSVPVTFTVTQERPGQS